MPTQRCLLKPAPSHCSKAGLKQRGWTERAIELFLKHHDLETPNPHYKSAAPMKLYLLTRVESIEKGADFLEFQVKSKKRVESSHRAVETKRERLLAKVRGWYIEVEDRNYQDVVKNAIKLYNRFKQEIAWERGIDGDYNFEYEPASLSSSKEFLERITVNYLRHNLSNYDANLEALFGKVGKGEAYDILNKRIYDKIAEVYPQLSAECGRQLRRKLEGDRSWA